VHDDTAVGPTISISSTPTNALTGSLTQSLQTE